MIKMAAGIDNGSLSGKDDVGDYWAKALQKVPDLYFELIEVTESVESIAIYYRSILGKRAIEVMYFNELGQINKMIAHYT